MRLFTREIEPRVVRYSYWVQFLKWLGEKLYNHAEHIVERSYNA